MRFIWSRVGDDGAGDKRLQLKEIAAIEREILHLISVNNSCDLA